MSVDERLQVITRLERDRAVLELHGELDLAGAPLLTSEIERAEGKAPRILVLDLEDLQFVDSAGLRVMLGAHQRSVERGAEFALTPGTPQVQRLLAITGVTEHMRTISSADETLLTGSGGPQAAA
jgi:anti-sigma B factor antagonist